jgi:hypothetical protein
MLYWLTSHFQDALESSHFGFLRVFHKFITFQAVAAVIFSFLTVMLAAPRMIGCGVKRSATTRISTKHR